MQPGCTTKRQKAEIARVNAAPHSRHANPIRHADIGKPVHARRRRHGIKPKLGAERCKGALCRRHIQLALATQKIRGIQIAQHQIGIRHRRFRAALPISRRPRHRAGAARTHLQRTARTDMADGTTTRAKRHDIQAFKRNALTGHIAATAKRGIAFLDQRNIGGGAANIKSDQILPEAAFRERHARRNTTRRPRQRRARRQARRFFHRRHATMREDHENRPAIARLFQPPAQPRQITRDNGADIGIHRRGRKPFKFLDLRQNLSRGRNENPRQRLAQRLGGGVFVPRVAPGMEETHCNSFNIFLAQLLNGGIEGSVIQRDFHPPIRAQPFTHRKPQAARHQRGGGGQAHIVAFGLQPFAHFNHIAMPFRGEHRNLRPLAFQKRIGGNRGAMDDAFCLPQ